MRTLLHPQHGTAHKVQSTWSNDQVTTIVTIDRTLELVLYSARIWVSTRILICTPDAPSDSVKTHLFQPNQKKNANSQYHQGLETLSYGYPNNASTDLKISLAVQAGHAILRLGFRAFT